MRIFDCLLASITALLVFSSAALANGYETYPAPLAWSPDGQQIAALISPAWPYDDGLLEGALLMFDQNGHDPRLIADYCVCGSPAFSPDGKSLAYIASDTLMLIDLAEFAAHPVRPAEPPADLQEDVVAPEDDGGWASWSWANAVTLIPGLPLDVCWAPPQYEGSGPTLLVTAGNRFYGCDIYRVDPQVFTSQRLTFAGPDNSALSPLMSADAQHLWFLRQDGLSSPSNSAAYERLHSINYSDSRAGDLPFAATDVAGDVHESNAVLCGPDSLLFQRGGWGDWQIWRLDLKTGSEYLEVADAQQPSLSADGRWLVYARRAADGKAAAEYDWEVLPQVWLLDRESGLEQQISDCPGGAEFPAITADGSRIAWLESVEGETRVHTALREALTAATPKP